MAATCSEKMRTIGDTTFQVRHAYVHVYNSIVIQYMNPS